MSQEGRYEKMPVHYVGNNIERRLLHSKNLMMVNVLFTDGPTTAPDPFHSHPHEQAAYIAEGEILLFMADEEPVHLKSGDHFVVESGVKHTIQRLTKVVRIIDCFTPIRQDFL